MQSGLTVRSNAVAYGHSHPFFANHWQMKQGVGCDSKKHWDSYDDDDMNRYNRNMTPQDMESAEAIGLPLYLVTPTRVRVMVYREVGTRWRVQRVR